MKVEFYTCGLNDYGQLSHGKEDGIFHEMEMPTNLKVKKMKCGRSHILFTTFDNYLYGFGANSYGQCGVGFTSNVDKWTKCITNEQNDIKNVTDFSCGWFHTLCVTENGTSLYYAGSCVSGFKDNDKFTKSNDIFPLNTNQIYTKVISGDHVCLAIIDNQIIKFFDYTPTIIDAQKEIGSTINEIAATNKGFILTNQFGELFAFNCLTNRELNLKKVILNGFVKNLTASHTHYDISYQLNNSKYYIKYQEEEEVYDADYEIQPLYYGALLYKRKERKLFAIGSNEDHTLGLSSKENFKELTEVTTINEYLKKNISMDIDEIIEGCDITVLVMKEKETKNLIFFNETLKKSINNTNNYLIDISITI